MLARRRFPDTIVRLREERGVRNDMGEFSPGRVIQTELRASVQPISTEDNLAIGSGGRLSERIRIYTPGDLRAAFEDRAPDSVRLADLREFAVEETRSWKGHTRAQCMREL